MKIKGIKPRETVWKYQKKLKNKRREFFFYTVSQLDQYHPSIFLYAILNGFCLPPKRKIARKYGNEFYKILMGLPRPFY